MAHDHGEPAARPERATISPSVAAVLARPVRESPEHEAVVGPGGRLSYRDLDTAAERVADALWALGVGRGTTMAVTLANDLDIVVLFHAAMRVGAVWVGINRLLAVDEKRFVVEDSGAAVYVADAVTAEAVRGVIDCRVIVVGAGEVAAGSGPWARPAGSRPSLVIDPHAPAALAYTSGTTGRPKGVLHSQHNLVVPGAVLVATRGYDATLRKGDCLALTILNMLVLTTVLTAQAGGTCIVTDATDAPTLAHWIHDERITVWNGVPTILRAMIDDPAVERQHLGSLREVWTGGDSCPPAIAEGVERRFGHRLTATYGLTEAPTVVSIDDAGGEPVPGTSGRVLPHLHVTIRDEAGREVAPGSVGEVCVEPTAEGPWAGLYRPMLGYLGHPEATTAALADGRLHTGDLGSLDPSGRLTIRSRRTALIIRGGANVYPAEVERVILELPGVAGCVVYGIPDDRLGQRVAAALESSSPEPPSPDDVRAACARLLARYKVPDRVVVVERLPRNAMGKVDRAVVSTW